MKNGTGFVGVWLVLSVLGVGCAHGKTDVPLTGTSLLPAAEGRVTLTGKDEANKSLHVVVHHLAQPQNLNAATVAPAGTESTPPQSYVVWVQPSGGAPVNVGVLVPDKNLDADLVTTTAQHKFDVFVTAEPSTTQMSPTGQRLLQAAVQD